MKRTALLRKTRIPQRRAKPRTHKFIVRLTGEKLARLRLECWMRDLGRCKQCGRKLFFEKRYEGDPLAYDMAHKKSRGAGGSDTLDNVEAQCHECHMREHNEGRGDCAA